MSERMIVDLQIGIGVWSLGQLLFKRSRGQRSDSMGIHLVICTKYGSDFTGIQRVIRFKFWSVPSHHGLYFSSRLALYVTVHYL